MRQVLRAAAIACALLGLAPLLGSCGGEAGTATGSLQRPGTTTDAAHPPRRSPCTAQLNTFIASLISLRRSLARGLSYTEYLPAVRDVRVAYRAIDPHEPDASCLLLAGGPAERAFNLYIDTANAWGECLTTAGCTTASIEPKLQRQWSKASGQLNRARRAAKGASG